MTGPRSATVAGTIVSFGPGTTGSWFAHAKDHKIWLERLEIEKADGEIVTLNLDQYSRVEPIEGRIFNRRIRSE